MIITLTLNPCIDRTVSVNHFVYGGTNRVESSRCDVSGKGINVSIALNNLGEKTLCLGFCYTGNGGVLKDFLDGQKIAYDFVEVGGEIRTNIKVFDSRTKIMSELNEAGPFTGEEPVRRLEGKVEEYLSGASLLVLDGSVPPGVPSDLYRRLAEKAAEHGVRTVVDAYGELLTRGVEARPFLIKPNRDELEEAFGEKIATRGDAVRVAKEIIRRGVELVCVSLGKNGALLVSEDAVYFSPGLNIAVRGVQGAGDSLVAGMSAAVVRGLPREEILRYGVAAAHGSLLHEGTQICSGKDFEEMLPRIPVEKL